MIITDEMLDDMEQEIKNSPDGKMSKIHMTMIMEQSNKDMIEHEKLVKQQRLGTDQWSVDFRAKYYPKQSMNI